jgi:hypothetical protein
LSSGLIPLISFGKVLTQSNFEVTISNEYVIPPEFIVQAIVTFGYGTHITKQAKMKKIPGVMNILSNADHVYPAQIFIKLMILSYLNRNGNKEGQTKQKIKEHFENCIKNMPNKMELLSSFDYCMHRLFNVGLITSPDLHYANSINDFENYVVDIRISLLGEYYIEELICMPEYLFYIKDDVYLENTESFEDAFYVFKNYPPNKYFWKNFRNLGNFLFEYGKIEIEFLKSLKSYNTLHIFKNNFTAISYDMFTLKIISGLEEYTKSPLYSDKMKRYINFQIFDSQDIRPLQDTKSMLLKLYNENIKDEL